MNAVSPARVDEHGDRVVRRRLELAARSSRPGRRRTGTGSGYSARNSRAGCVLSPRVDAEERDLACRARSRRCWKAGNSARHGPHHDAHLLITTGWPCSSASAPAERRHAALEQLARTARAAPRAAPARRASSARRLQVERPRPRSRRPARRRRRPARARSTSTAVRMTTPRIQGRARFTPHTVADHCASHLRGLLQWRHSRSTDPRGPRDPLADQASDLGPRIRGARAAVGRGSLHLSLPPSRMADPTSVAVEAAPTIPSADAIERAAAFTREPFVLEGEDAAAQLAPGTRAPARARRRAGGARRRARRCRRSAGASAGRCCSGSTGCSARTSRSSPTAPCSRAHQVDALSGTLTALLAESGNGIGLERRRGRTPTRRRSRRRASPARRSSTTRTSRRSRRTGRTTRPRRGATTTAQLARGARGSQRRQALLVRARDRAPARRSRRSASSRARAPAAR